jgi:hypothetical protein
MAVADGGAVKARVCGRTFSEGVILSEAKDLLFVRPEGKADPSVAQNRRTSG